MWDFPGVGFGDLWAALSFCLWQSATTGEPQHISRWAGEQDMKPRLEEMLALFDIRPPVSVVVSDLQPDKSMYQDCWSGKRWPCKVRWQPTERAFPVVAYQLDGKSSAELKNASVKEEILFHKQGWTAIKIGLPYSIQTCAVILSKVDAFMGVCSGMAHLAHSVGVPVYLLEYQHSVQWWHGENPITICSGVADLARKFNTSLQRKS